MCYVHLTEMNGEKLEVLLIELRIFCICYCKIESNFINMTVLFQTLKRLSGMARKKEFASLAIKLDVLCLALNFM